MKIIKQREYKTNSEFNLEYQDLELPDSFWCFDCDKNGVLLKEYDAYNKIQSGAIKAVFKGIKKYSWNYVEAAIGKCDCGAEIELYDPLDNFCSCGACYNYDGQLVTPSADCDESGNPYDYDY